MLGRFRTVGSISRSRTSANPELLQYTVKPTSASKHVWAVRLLGASCATFLLAPHIVKAYNNFELPTKPVFIPVGMIEEVAPVPYKRGSAEENAFARFMQDEKTKDKAELLILEKAVDTILKSPLKTRLNIGHPAGFGPSYWMLWEFPKPQPTYRRRYLRISADKGVSFETRPVSHQLAYRVSSIFYPTAVFSGIYAYFQTLYGHPTSPHTDGGFIPSPQRAVNITNARMDRIKAKRAGTDPASTSNASTTNSNQTPVEQQASRESLTSADDLSVGLFTPMELRRATHVGLSTLSREWTKAHPPAPPPRGWPIADARFMLNGPNLSLTIDMLAAINPKKVESGQVIIMSMKVRHMQPNKTGQVLLGSGSKEGR